jgi:hypothetical protein
LVERTLPDLLPATLKFPVVASQRVALLEFQTKVGFVLYGIGFRVAVMLAVGATTSGVTVRLQVAVLAKGPVIVKA